jgi:hypothetical protein
MVGAQGRWINGHVIESKMVIGGIGRKGWVSSKAASGWREKGRRGGEKALQID